MSNKLHHASPLASADFLNDRSASTSTVRGEIALWRAVILQALEDAASRSAKQKERYYKDRALHWLQGKSEDFYLVCDYADLHPEATRRKIKRALLNGCKWRAEPGKGRRPKKKKVQIAGKGMGDSDISHTVAATITRINA